MDQLDALNQVAEFHRTFHHPIEPQPVIPAEDRCRLRVNLIAEELKELEEAIQNKDIIEVADALCDIQYVLAGAVLEFGLGEKFRALFDEVQRSNMSKTCKSLEEAEATAHYYKKEKGFECYIKQSGEHFLVYRADDHKTLKSIAYSPADLEGILREGEGERVRE
ncbi:MAG: nucleoside triphosphate pyrophosphohydrolase family protein [Lewinellaceae bacterium]|nr:nucleoside triphosphate pyrophosphohydrolase family protein [Lewinellaceae bacterium]